MRHPPMTAYPPGWGSPASQTTRPTHRDLLRQLVVPGLLAGYLLWKGVLFSVIGLITFALAMWVWFTIKNAPHPGRILVEYTVVAALVVLLGSIGVSAPDIKIAADRKAPTERVTEAKGYLDQARQGIENIKADIATRYADRFPSEPTKKGHR